MDTTVNAWIGSVSTLIIRFSIVLFVAVNAAAVATVLLKRDRALVQRWTGPWLATNAVLIGAGVGAPLLAGLAKLAVSAFAGAVHLAASAAK